MNATKKQTAGNNATLARVKRVWNAKIFKKATAIMNAEGEAAVVAYLRQYVREGVDVVAHMDMVIARLDATKGA